MPRYYFNLFNDEIAMDPEGLELSDDSAALAHATDEAREMAADSVRRGRFVGSHYIEVKDAGSQSLGIVRFDQAVDIRP